MVFVEVEVDDDELELDPQAASTSTSTVIDAARVSERLIMCVLFMTPNTRMAGDRIVTSIQWQ